MSLAGRFVGVIWKHFEGILGASEQVAHQKLAVEISIEAEKIACRLLEDSQAKAMLSECLEADRDSIDAAQTILLRRSEYVSDRAYRLLSALSDDTPVAPVPQHLEQLFGQEEALGRMPLDRAFEHLAEIEPRLLDLERQMSRGDIVGTERSAGVSQDINEALIGLVGVRAGRDYALLGTNLAASITRQYLEILGGATILGSVSTPYFDAPLKIGVRA